MTRTVFLLGRYFYRCMSLIIAAVVMYGFSHTVDKGLIQAVPVSSIFTRVDDSHLWIMTPA